MLVMVNAASAGEKAEPKQYASIAHEIIDLFGPKRDHQLKTHERNDHHENKNRNDVT